MALIRKPNEIVLQPKIKMLIYGQAGTGKSTLALSAPCPLMLDCDGGIHRVNFGHHSDTVQVKSYDDVMNSLGEDLTPYETIIIDTGGKLLDYMSEFITARNPKMGKPNGSLTLQGYGERKREFSEFCRKVSMLGKHLVFVAHRETHKEGDSYRYVPLFGGSSYDALVTELDLVLYLEAVGKQRVLTADPSDRNDGKNTCNLPAQIQLPGVLDKDGNGLANTFLQTGIIAPYIARLNQAQEQRARYDSVMAEIREQLLLVTDESSMNGLIGRMSDFDHAGASKEAAFALMNVRARELQLLYNKQLKCYERKSAA
jgi:hypothetical protein